MSPWRSKKGISVGSTRLDVLAEHHLTLLKTFRTILTDPTVADSSLPDRFSLNTTFLALSEFRYFLYLRLLIEDRKSASVVLPPWDVAILFYIHLLQPEKFLSDLRGGVWGLPGIDAVENKHDVLKRFSFPFAQLVAVSNRGSSESSGNSGDGGGNEKDGRESAGVGPNTWTDPFSTFEWSQKYPLIPYQPFTPLRSVRVARLAQNRTRGSNTNLFLSLRCPACYASLRCSVQEFPAFRRGDSEKPLACRRSNCQPVRYSQLSAGYRGPWDSQEDLAGLIEEAMFRVGDGLLVSGDVGVHLGAGRRKQGVKGGVERYERFMGLMKTTGANLAGEGGRVLAPTGDVDLCWRTHRVVPGQYRKWYLGTPAEVGGGGEDQEEDRGRDRMGIVMVGGVVGREIADEEIVGWHVFDDGTPEGKATEMLWTAAYKEPYYQSPKRSFLERLLGIGKNPVPPSLPGSNPNGGNAAGGKRISKRRGSGSVNGGSGWGIDIPRFAYDPAAYTAAGAAAAMAEVPGRESSIGATGPREGKRMHQRRYTSDGTMVPPGSGGSSAAGNSRGVNRGSFVPTVQVGNARPAMSNSGSKRRNTRHNKRVSVLPAIKSMDSMMGDSSDAPSDPDLSSAEQVESETGLHRTKSPLSFSSTSLTDSNATSTAASTTTTRVTPGGSPTSPSFPPLSPTFSDRTVGPNSSTGSLTGIRGRSRVRNDSLSSMEQLSDVSLSSTGTASTVRGGGSQRPSSSSSATYTGPAPTNRRNSLLSNITTAPPPQVVPSQQQQHQKPQQQQKARSRTLSKDRSSCLSQNQRAHSQGPDPYSNWPASLQPSAPPSTTSDVGNTSTSSNGGGRTHSRLSSSFFSYPRSSRSRTKSRTRPASSSSSVHPTTSSTGATPPQLPCPLTGQSSASLTSSFSAATGTNIGTAAMTGKASRPLTVRPSTSSSATGAAYSTPPLTSNNYHGVNIWQSNYNPNFTSRNPPPTGFHNQHLNGNGSDPHLPSYPPQGRHIRSNSLGTSTLLSRPSSSRSAAGKEIKPGEATRRPGSSSSSVNLSLKPSSSNGGRERNYPNLFRYQGSGRPSTGGGGTCGRPSSSSSSLALDGRTNGTGLSCGSGTGLSDAGGRSGRTGSVSSAGGGNTYVPHELAGNVGWRRFVPRGPVVGGGSVSSGNLLLDGGNSSSTSINGNTRPDSGHGAQDGGGEGRGYTGTGRRFSLSAGGHVYGYSDPQQQRQPQHGQQQQHPIKHPDTHGAPVLPQHSCLKRKPSTGSDVSASLEMNDVLEWERASVRRGSSASLRDMLPDGVDAEGEIGKAVPMGAGGRSGHEGQVSATGGAGGSLYVGRQRAMMYSGDESEAY